MQRPLRLSRLFVGRRLPRYLNINRLGVATVEMLGTVAALFIYFFIRGGRPDDIEASVTRGLQIVNLEKSLGIFTEVRWQEVFLQYDLLMDIANQVYAWGHYPVLAAIGTWLAIKNPSRFRFVRNVMLLSGLVGIAAYWLLPTAPPRLIHLSGIDFGFVDTVHGSADVVYLQPAPFVNDFAALPSFHFGWIALASAAIWVNTQEPVPAPVRRGPLGRHVVGDRRDGEPFLLRHGARRPRCRHLLDHGRLSRPDRCQPAPHRGPAADRRASLDTSQRPPADAPR